MPASPPTSDAPPSAIAHPVLEGERVAFTGTLASMTHRHAADLVVQHGGSPMQHVGQQTTLLVIGEEGWPLEPDGQPSVKLVQAQALQQRGAELRILTESEWLSALGLEPPIRATQLLTPAMLSGVLGVPVTVIRKWERLGLIHPVRRVLRLPYFDYAEVTAARRLSQLLESGVPIRELAASLEHLRAVLPGLDRPLAQLEILGQGARVVCRHKDGWIEPRSGQRVFDFELSAHEDEAGDEPAVLSLPAAAPTDVSQWTADDWFREGCLLSEEGATAAAVEAFRLALIDRPHQAEWHFQLADVLYRQGHRRAAMERYYVAVEHDHDFIEAWTQLGCVLAEEGELTSARDAFQVALDRHPEYPDAHFHLAALLNRLGETDRAREHWTSYLQCTPAGPWAEFARQQLGQSAAMLFGERGDVSPPCDD